MLRARLRSGLSLRDTKSDVPDPSKAYCEMSLRNACRQFATASSQGKEYAVHRLIDLANRLNLVVIFGLTHPLRPSPSDVRFGSVRRGFFRSVTLWTEKERARCLSMSIGVINMAGQK